MPGAGLGPGPGAGAGGSLSSQKMSSFVIAAILSHDFCPCLTTGTESKTGFSTHGPRNLFFAISSKALTETLGNEFCEFLPESPYILS